MWRADRPARGRFREFYQCDIDAIGSTSPVVEVEVLAAVSEVLTTLGFADFRVRLNDRRVLQALLAAAGVPPDRARRTRSSRLTSSTRLGRTASRADSSARGLDAAVAEACLRAVRPPRSTRPAGRVAAGSRGRGSAIGRVCWRRVAAIVALAEATPAAGRIRIDPSLARGLSYYTGAIMEIAVPDLAGSLGGGGRYDNLVGMFLGREVPACGFSLGLERIIVVMAERGMFPAAIGIGAGRRDGGAVGRVVSGGCAGAGRRSCVGTACDVDVYPEPDKPGRQFKYAGVAAVPDRRAGRRGRAPRRHGDGQEHADRRRRRRCRCADVATIVRSELNGNRVS